MKVIMQLNNSNKYLQNHNPGLPIATLFLIQSIDGKITTGIGDERDFDSDIVVHSDLKQGMMDYYNIEANTDYWSCISGRIASKLGANENKFFKERKRCCFVVFDNSHLTHEGRQHIANNCDNVIFVTNNKSVKEGLLPFNAKTLLYNEFNPTGIFKTLKSQYNIDRITIQTGGKLNSTWFQWDIIDYIKIVIAPIIIGGCDTTTLVDGKNSLMDSEYGKKEFSKFKLQNIQQLNDGFICIDYVRNRSVQERIIPYSNSFISQLEEMSMIHY